MSEAFERKAIAVDVCKTAEGLTLGYFHDRDTLMVVRKGAQDWVSEADKNVEMISGEAICRAWRDGGIYGEEHGPATAPADLSGSSIPSTGPRIL